MFAGGRNHDRSGRGQGIVAEVVRKGQSAGSEVRTTEDTS